MAQPLKHPQSESASEYVLCCYVVHQSMQTRVFIYLPHTTFVFIFISGRIVGATSRIRANTVNPVFGTALLLTVSVQNIPM